MASINAFNWNHASPFQTNEAMATMSVDELATASKLDWGVSKQPLYTRVGDEMKEVVGKYMLERDTDNAPLSIVGTKYKPIQNREWLDFAAGFCEAGGATIQNAGSFGNGKFVFVMAKLGDSFNLRKNRKDTKDEMGGFACLVQPHVHAYGVMMLATPVRFACFNALPRLISAAKMGKSGRIFSMSHSRVFTPAMRDAAATALGAVSENIAAFRKEAETLISAKADEHAVKAYFDNVVNFDREAATKAAAAANKTMREPRVIAKLQEALEKSPGAELNTAKGTFWGALNAVTYTMDHMMGREKDSAETAFGSSLIGDRSMIKRRALSLALEMAAA